MPENILDFLFNPFVSRLITVLIGFLVIGLLAHWLQRWLTRHIRNQRTLSNVGQVIRFLCYLAYSEEIYFVWDKISIPVRYGGADPRCTTALGT